MHATLLLNSGTYEDSFSLSFFSLVVVIPKRSVVKIAEKLVMMFMIIVFKNWEGAIN